MSDQTSPLTFITPLGIVKLRGGDRGDRALRYFERFVRLLAHVLCHRFPTEIISYAVWLYNTIPLSYRDVQKLLLYRGIEVSREAIRAWCQKFGQQFANKICRRRPQPGAKWYLDEMVILSNGEHFYLWRAVDEDGNVLDILMQRRRDKAAAKKFFRKLLKKQGFASRVIVMDKLKSYGAAKRDLLPSVEHRYS